MGETSRRGFLQAAAVAAAAGPAVASVGAAARKYRIAVIGRTGQGDYGHGLDTVWLRTDRAEVVAVADEDPKGRTAAAARLKTRVEYADYRELLAKEKPEIVAVAPRWPDCHRDMVVACAEHGAHVFLEKPVARTLREADEMAAACDRHKVKCAVAHTTRSSPRTKVVRDLIAAGRIGDILELRAHGKEDGRGGGEDLLVLGTHLFDLMRLFAGDARWCFARVNQGGRRAGPEDVRPGGERMGPVAGDHIAAQYGFDGLPVGSFYSHRAKDGAGRRFWLGIHGTKGVIHLATGGLPAAYLCEDPSWMPGAGKAGWQEITSNGLGKPETLDPKEVGNGNLPAVLDLMDAIEQDRPPVCSVTDGRAALEMVLAVYESHRLGTPVDLPLKTRDHPLAGWR
ncbi:MAG: Gfo/Idh/MocA family oxidoreductase [Gemmataceae bacterium]|nr:Gfo/Idh/MocA family oxidoreductase [Gemmataceae bacterium]